MTSPTFTDRAARFAAILDGVTDWDAPTPCPGWTVRDVVGHAIASERDFLQRHDLLDPASTEPDLTRPDLAWRTHAEATEAALTRPGVVERTFDGYFGPTTIGATMADFYGWDLVIHGWDVAVAGGQAWSLTDEEAAAMSATADSWGDALYSDGVCGPAVAVPGDAPATDRLLARLGRDPGWKAPAGVG